MLKAASACVISYLSHALIAFLSNPLNPLSPIFTLQIIPIPIHTPVAVFLHNKSKQYVNSATRNLSHIKTIKNGIMGVVVEIVFMDEIILKL